MKAIIRIIWIVVLLIYVDRYVGARSTGNTELKGNNVCHRFERYEDKVKEPSTKRVKTTRYTWCLNIPPRCTVYEYKNVTTFKIILVNKTRLIDECCKGYERKHDSCVPVCRLGCGPGTCVEPDTCLCDEGWREPFCQFECEPNRFGKGCNNNCTCLHGATCDSKSGFCYCTEGYTGTHCELPCPDDTYGLNCQYKCECENGALCDIKDGTCDCLPGYVGEHCENPCDPGSHGENCEKDCICINESTDFCNHVDGKCICKPGYKGEFCGDQCDNFTYGPSCDKKCNCSNSDFCDPFDGKCVCKPGWMGTTCSEKCPSGTFGQECKYICIECLNETATCNHITGHCDCPAGRYGVVCQKQCPMGYWGTDCKNECECKNGSTCHAVTGICLCSPKLKDSGCTDREAKNDATKTEDNDVSYRFYASLRTGFIVVITLIILAVFFIFIAKRNSGRGLPCCTRRVGNDADDATEVTEYAANKFSNPGYGISGVATQTTSAVEDVSFSGPLYASVHSSKGERRSNVEEQAEKRDSGIGKENASKENTDAAGASLFCASFRLKNPVGVKLNQDEKKNLGSTKKEESRLKRVTCVGNLSQQTKDMDLKASATVKEIKRSASVGDILIRIPDDGKKDLCKNLNTSYPSSEKGSSVKNIFGLKPLSNTERKKQAYSNKKIGLMLGDEDFKPEELCDFSIDENGNSMMQKN